VVEGGGIFPAIATCRSTLSSSPGLDHRTFFRALSSHLLEIVHGEDGPPEDGDKEDRRENDDGKDPSKEDDGVDLPAVGDGKDSPENKKKVLSMIKRIRQKK
jgi:hypothetical protein